MDLEFGKKVQEQALQLQKEGKDANQTAKILCDRDDEGCNYGIGIMLDGEGKAMASSQALLEYAAVELENSAAGSYLNSAKLMDDLKQAVLQWQRVPEEHWDGFLLAVPSDAGTGAVKSALELELTLDADLKTIGIEQLGWPAYKAMAKASRVRVEEFPLDGAITGDGVLPLYQSGPMNTTGNVHGKEVIEARAQAAAESGGHVVLDRAYSGFEYAGRLEDEGYDGIMRLSYELQLRPFIERQVPFSLAVSPTKAFGTFALRPCGMLLVHCPDSSQRHEVTTALNGIMRARGSSFEHPITRGFVKALTQARERLEEEHATALRRIAEAEALWRKLVKGTQIEQLYTEDYAGLFRNPKAGEDAPAHIYNAHIYPVFSSGRCRQNITGLPSDEELAARHVAVFAEHCR